nr:hypothetical protein [Metamycoplasma hominis]
MQSELNTAWPKLTIFFGKTTDEILVPKKALSPIDFNPSFNLTSLSSLKSLNAPSSISLTEVGIVIDFWYWRARVIFLLIFSKPLHKAILQSLLNISLDSEVTELGIVTEEILVPKNASLPILSSPSFKVNSFKLSQ